MHIHPANVGRIALEHTRTCYFHLLVSHLVKTHIPDHDNTFAGAQRVHGSNA